jgi:PAS domain S-box-containing protein
MRPQGPKDQQLHKKGAASWSILPLLQTQFAVSKVLASAEDLPSALPSIIASICINLEWELGAFWQHAATRPVLMCTNISAADETLGRFIAESRKNELLAGEGLAGRVFATSQPEWIADIRADRDFLPASAIAQVGLQSAFAFPVLAGSDAIAVLEFLSSKFREPDQELLQNMLALGQQLGQFIRRKEAEEALQQALEIYHNLADFISDGIITIDESGTIMLANRAAESIFGYPAAELKRQNLTMLMPEHWRVKYEHTVVRYLEMGRKAMNRTVEVVGRHKDGHEIFLDLSFAEFTVKDQRYLTGFMRERTEVSPMQIHVQGQEI